jgi:hypothetical protein
VYWQQQRLESISKGIRRRPRTTLVSNPPEVCTTSFSKAQCTQHTLQFNVKIIISVLNVCMHACMGIQ